MNKTWLMVLGWLTCAGIFHCRAENLRPWNDYHVIMWISGKTVADPAKIPLVTQRLQEMGVSAGMVTGDGDPSMWTQAKMPYYVENIVRTGLCLKQRSPVTDWSKFVSQWMETRDESAFVRPYCLEDPGWFAESRKQMQRAVGLHKANAPLMYDIRDELSVTTSANPFDYDFSPQSLAGFRKWLQEQYETLEALNKQWDTDFPSWEAVKPFSTDQIKARMVSGERMPKGPPDWSALKQVKFDPLQAAKEPVKWNFSPWCDFRTYMDTVLSRTLDNLRLSARAVDSATPVGIEGTQMPHAFGGYDLWKLSQNLDWMEPYDVGNSREILGDFMPGKPLFCTLFEKDAEHAMRRLWHLLLLGDKGCIVWWSEDCIDASKPDCPLTEKGRALAPVFREMQSPLAKLFMLAEREVDPIAIHYSQASIQVAWLLESVADGRSWPRRFSSFEADHSRHAAVRNGWIKVLQDLGYTPQFISTPQINEGVLSKNGILALVLTEGWAVGPEELTAIGAWSKTETDQRLLLHTSAAAPFDGRGKLNLARIIDVFGGEQPALRKTGDLVYVRLSEWGADEDADLASYPSDRLRWRKNPSESEPLRVGNVLIRTQEQLGRIMSLPRRSATPAGACIRTHRYRLGDSVRLIAFERGVDYHMSEDLKQAGGNEPLEKPITFTAKLSEKAHVYDLRSGTYLGRQTDLVVDLDPWKPSLFALLPEKLPEGRGAVETLLSKVAPAQR